MTYKTISGQKVKLRRHMAHWGTLLNAWIAVHEKYAAATEDAAYWYTERTNVGILAQAAWQSEFIALEEYQTKKTARHNSTTESNGRCDLWISIPKFQYIIEAKQQYIQLGSTRNTEVTNSYLKKAMDDAKRTIGFAGEEAIGLVFLPAYYPVAKCQPKAIEKQIEKSIELINASTADLVAWCFPGVSRTFKGQNEVNYIPGLFMVASVVGSDTSLSSSI